MKRKIDNNDMKERLITTALELIDQQGGLHGVNLRQIAAKAGCAHTNIYNYYQNFEDLLWDVIIRIGTKWEETSDYELTDQMTLEEITEKFALVQNDLAREHPGWYRCLWQEPLSGKLPERVLNSRREQRDAISQAFSKASKNRLNQVQANRLFQMLFSFIHGSISLLINGRVVRTSRADYEVQVLENVRFIVKAFLKENSQVP